MDGVPGAEVKGYECENDGEATNGGVCVDDVERGVGELWRAQVVVKLMAARSGF